MMRSNLRLLTVYLLIPFPSITFAQSDFAFYLSRTRDDSNRGTEAAPWRTIQHAANVAQAGSTVNIRGRIYDERVIINVSGNATAGFITFQSHPGKGTGRA
jgi:hypothetical protein